MLRYLSMNGSGQEIVKLFLRKPLTHEDRVRCQIELEKGRVKRFVIQYEILVSNEW